MGEAAAEGIPGQAAVDAGQDVYLALHGAAVVRRGGRDALRRGGTQHGADGRGGDGPLPAASAYHPPVAEAVAVLRQGLLEVFGLTKNIYLIDGLETEISL